MTDSQDVHDRIAEARRALARTALDPTLRALLTELFDKEQAETVADRALEAASEAIAERDERIATLDTGRPALIRESIAAVRGAIAEHGANGTADGGG